MSKNFSQKWNGYYKECMKTLVIEVYALVIKSMLQQSYRAVANADGLIKRTQKTLKTEIHMGGKYKLYEIVQRRLISIDKTLIRIVIKLALDKRKHVVSNL